MVRGGSLLTNEKETVSDTYTTVFSSCWGQVKVKYSFANFSLSPNCFQMKPIYNFLLKLYSSMVKPPKSKFHKNYEFQKCLKITKIDSKW